MPNESTKNRAISVLFQTIGRQSPRDRHDRRGKSARNGPSPVAGKFVGKLGRNSDGGVECLRWLGEREPTKESQKRTFTVEAARRPVVARAISSTRPARAISALSASRARLVLLRPQQ